VFPSLQFCPQVLMQLKFSAFLFSLFVFCSVHVSFFIFYFRLCWASKQSDCLFPVTAVLRQSSACQLMCDIDLQPLLGADEISEVLTVAGCYHTHCTLPIILSKVSEHVFLLLLFELFLVSLSPCCLEVCFLFFPFAIFRSEILWPYYLFIPCFYSGLVKLLSVENFSSEEDIWLNTTGFTQLWTTFTFWSSVWNRFCKSLLLVTYHV
jgi:hypothetical protein